MNGIFDQHRLWLSVVYNLPLRCCPKQCVVQQEMSLCSLTRGRTERKPAVLSSSVKYLTANKTD